MNEIKDLSLSKLHNEEHAEFMNVFKGKLNHYTAALLTIVPPTHWRNC